MTEEITTEVSKQLINKASEFLEKIVNPPLKELGGLLADKVKFWRFKNQINTIIKAENFISKKGIQPKKIRLKTLFQLLEYSSWEEDPDMQTKWASLLANAVNPEYSHYINSSYIEILNQISPLEAKVLDLMFQECEDFRLSQKLELSQYYVIRISFHSGFKKRVCKDFNISLEQIIILFDNLHRLNLLQAPTFSADKPESCYYDLIQFTPLGYEFIKHCKFQ